MRYFLKFIIIFSLLLTSCSKEEEKSISISFVKDTYNLEHTNHTVEILLNFSEAATSAGYISLEFSGNAERLDDFKCPTQLNFREGDSGSSFEFEVLFNSKNPAPKSVTISLTPSAGYKTGEFGKSTIIID